MSSPTNAARIAHTLEYVGLGANEALLYSVMLRYPRSTVQQLRLRTPFTRTMLYYVLDRLIALGLVRAKREAGRTAYMVESPDRLSDILERHEEDRMMQVRAVRELIPELKQQYRRTRRRPDVRVFEGMRAYARALDELIVDQRDEICAFGDADVLRTPGREIRETHERRRIAKRITKRVLLPPSVSARAMLRTRPYDDYTQFRFAADAVDLGTIDVQLAAGKFLSTTSEDREPIAVIVEDRSLFALHRSVFEELWRGAKDATLLRYES